MDTVRRLAPASVATDQFGGPVFAWVERLSRLSGWLNREPDPTWYYVWQALNCAEAVRLAAVDANQVIDFIAESLPGRYRVRYTERPNPWDADCAHRELGRLTGDTLQEVRSAFPIEIAGVNPLVGLPDQPNPFRFEYGAFADRLGEAGIGGPLYRDLLNAVALRLGRVGDRLRAGRPAVLYHWAMREQDLIRGDADPEPEEAVVTSYPTVRAYLSFDPSTRQLCLPVPPAGVGPQTDIDLARSGTATSDGVETFEDVDDRGRPVRFGIRRGETILATFEKHQPFRLLRAMLPLLPTGGSLSVRDAKKLLASDADGPRWANGLCSEVNRTIQGHLTHKLYAASNAADDDLIGWVPVVR